MQQKKAMGFIEGAMIIAIANIIVKIIGAAFKIPLDRWILQTDGMALYNTSYTIYNLLFVISTAGLPTAISKLVAESVSKDDLDGANKILKISFMLLFVLGLLGSLILGFGAGTFSNLVGYSDAYYTMLAMSPSLLFVGCMSSFRGYFQGRQNMFPTAISEVIEAICKLVVGFSLAYLLLPMGKPMASAGAILGVTTGGLCGFLFLVTYYINYKKRDVKTNKTTALKNGKVLKQIIKIAVPITLGVSVFTITSFIDTAMVTNQMKGYVNSDVMTASVAKHVNEKKFQSFSEISQKAPKNYPGVGETELKEKITENRAAFVYGYLTRAITLFNMPPTIIAAIAISVVPAIAAANASGDKKKSKGFTASALTIAALLALPCAVGMSVLSEPILRLVYGDGSYSSLLTIMGISILFLTLVQIENAVLQAWGKVWIPVVNMLIGGMVKVLVNLTLVSRPAININGAPIGTLLCYITVMSLNLVFIKKHTDIKLGVGNFAIKPVLCSGIMGIFTYMVYKGLSGFGVDYKLSMLCAIISAVIVYAGSIIATKAMKEEDILLLPKGSKLALLMKKKGLL
ncbi:MAG: polysaccharide biosynthesis protein [Bacillota bacterium]|nr:polysaccharide biosynthesis protein [Bacillota bacterium]